MKLGDRKYEDRNFGQKKPAEAGIVEFWDTKKPAEAGIVEFWAQKNWLKLASRNFGHKKTG